MEMAMEGSGQEGLNGREHTAAERGGSDGGARAARRPTAILSARTALDHVAARGRPWRPRRLAMRDGMARGTHEEYAPIVLDDCTS